MIIHSEYNGRPLRWRFPVSGVAVSGASSSQFSVAYDEPASLGLPIESYLVEWTTASTFTETSETWTIELTNEPFGLADLQGVWYISVGSFRTGPLSPRAMGFELTVALNVLRNLGALVVTKTESRSKATYEVKLLQVPRSRVPVYS